MAGGERRWCGLWVRLRAWGNVGDWGNDEESRGNGKVDEAGWGESVRGWGAPGVRILERRLAGCHVNGNCVEVCKTYDFAELEAKAIISVD